MTTNNDVPLALRPVLEALRDAAGWMRIEVQSEEDARRTAQKQHAAWLDLEARCARALASDAGMPEGERVEGWTGKPGPCPNCGAIRNERDAHFCSSTRSAPAPLAEPDAAAPGPEGRVAEGDAELDRLISEYGRAHARATELLIWPNDTPQCRAAIHAHVERVKREARGEVVATARFRHTANRYIYMADVRLTNTEHFTDANGFPVDLVRRREKEEG